MKTMAILLGGFLPAILFGISGVFQKVSSKAGIATGPYLAIIGLTTLCMGGIFIFVEKDATINSRSAIYSGLFGVFWSLAIGLIAIALRRYNAQISQLVPLYNMNTLVAVVLGLIVMAEWSHISVPKIIVASALIIVGGIIAASA